MNRYNHVNKLAISIPDSLSILQSLNNANVADTLRVAMLGGGFIGNAFKPDLATSAATSSSGECMVAMLSGDVIFPNGEVFRGDSSTVSIAIPRSDNAQFLMLAYQPLRHVRLDKADGYGENDAAYGFRRDGVRLYLIDSGATSVAVNDLLIAEIKNPLDGNPVLIDRRASARQYRSSSALDPRIGGLATMKTLYHGFIDDSTQPCGNASRSAIHNDDSAGMGLSFSAMPEISPFVYLLLLRSGLGWRERSSAHWGPHRGHVFVPGLAGDNVRGAGVAQDRNDSRIASAGEGLGQLTVGVLDATIDTTLEAVADPGTHGVLIAACISRSEGADVEEATARAYTQIWARDGSISHSLDPAILPPHAERDLTPRGTDDGGCYPRVRYTPMGSSRLILLGSRTVLPGRVTASMTSSKLTRTGVTWIHLNLGPDFGWTETYGWYHPDLTTTDTWWHYYSYPQSGGISPNYGRQTWWDNSEIATFRAPGDGWMLSEVVFVNRYVAPQPSQPAYITATKNGEATAVEVKFVYNNSRTQSPPPIPLAADDVITFSLDGAEGEEYYASGYISVALVKEARAVSE